MPLTKQDIWKALEQVKDPEIPAVSLIEMGIIREVDVKDKVITVTITPTFSGCPALHVMQQNICDTLGKLYPSDIRVETRYSPPWSSDLITKSGRQKLKAFGLTPPKVHGGNVSIILLEPVACPYCDSENTILKNSWGPTPCRMIFYCNACSQPFERFKPL